jgi:hypothetical protein
MTVNGVRVSKTSFKKWFLHGPVDQALKTSTQADEVKCYPLTVSVHGAPVSVELWCNAQEAAKDGTDELNPHAQSMLQEAHFREQGTTVEEAFAAGYALPSLPVIKGVAVLTGPGCSDFPPDAVQCTLAALVGVHPSTHE